MQQVIQDLQELRQVSGNAQIDLLKQKKNDLLRQVLEYTYDTSKKYKIDENKLNKIFIQEQNNKDLTVEDWNKYIKYLDKLCDLTEQNIIWHKSNDDLLMRTFKDRTNGLNLMYSLTDLGANRMAAIEQKNEIRYVYIPEADCIGDPAIREEIYDGTENHDLWFFAQKTIKQELEELDKKHKDIDAISEILLGDNDDF